MMNSREVMLSRIRQAAQQGRLYRVHVSPQPEGVGYLGARGDLCQRLAEEVNAVGGQAYVVGDLDAARRQLQELLAEASARSAVCWQHELLDRLGLGKLLTSSGVTHYNYERLARSSPEEQRRVLLSCDIGITSCDAAIAETGTLMMCSGCGRERVASLLPPMHVAVVSQRQIVPDLFDAFALLKNGGAARNERPPLPSIPAELPGNVTFITGPSKTGDIELQLTTGVHGPGKWRVIVVCE